MKIKSSFFALLSILILQSVFFTIIFVTFGLGAVARASQEKITLQAPVFVDSGAAEFRVGSLYLNRKGSEIRATFNEVVPGTTTFVEPVGKSLTCSYNGAAADSLLAALNKMNFATTSLEKRVTTQCQNDGKLGAGSISGVPQ